MGGAGGRLCSQRLGPGAATRGGEAGRGSALARTRRPPPGAPLIHCTRVRAAFPAETFEKSAPHPHVSGPERSPPPCTPGSPRVGLGSREVGAACSALSGARPREAEGGVGGLLLREVAWCRRGWRASSGDSVQNEPSLLREVPEVPPAPSPVVLVGRGGPALRDASLNPHSAVTAGRSRHCAVCASLRLARFF